MVVVQKQKVDNFCPARVSGGMQPEIMRQCFGGDPKLMIRTSCPHVKLANHIPPRNPFDREYDSPIFLKNKLVCLSFGIIDLRLAAYPKVYRLASPGQGGGGPNQTLSHLPPNLVIVTRGLVHK